MSVSCLSTPCLDQLTDLAQWEAELAGDPVKAESALITRLSTVPDPRSQRGLRHRLIVVLALTACATLVVGGDSVTAIWQWAARVSQDKLAALGARRDPLTGRFSIPSERTFRRILQLLDGDSLDTAIGQWGTDVAQGAVPAPVVPRTPGPDEREERRARQRACQHPTPDGILPGAAIDGKALRGARTATGRVFLVAALDHTSGESVETIQPDLIIPTGKRKGHAPSLASIYRALAEHEKTLAYPEAVEQARSEYAEQRRTDSPTDTLRPRPARVFEVVSDAKRDRLQAPRHPR